MNLLEISQTIRRVRQAQGMTLEQLAKKSGFSKGFLSQLENFRQSPNLKTLAKIADALGMPMSAMFHEGGDNTPQYTFGNLNSGEAMTRDDGEEYGIHYSALAFPQIGRKMDPFVIEYTGGKSRDYKCHEADEFLVLLEGTLDYYLYDDGLCHHMKTGDTLYLRANVPHRVELPQGCTYAKGLVVYTEVTITAE